MKRGLSPVTQAPPLQRVVCDKEMAGLEWKKRRNKCFDNCVGRRPGPNRYQRMQVEQVCLYEDSSGKSLIRKRL